MNLKGVGGIQKIYFDLDKVTKQFTNQNSFKKNYQKLFHFRKRLFEIALIDTLYFNYNIFAYHSLNSLVISPSLIIKKKQIDYVFSSLNKVFQLGPKNIIKNYLKRQSKIN